MDSRGVRLAPFGEFVGLIRWVSVRRRWHIFHGWCLAHGVKPFSLSVPEFLNLIDYFILAEIISENEAEAPVVVEEGKDPPPAWMGWKNNTSQHEDMLAAWEARKK